MQQNGKILTKMVLAIMVINTHTMHLKVVIVMVTDMVTMLTVTQVMIVHKYLVIQPLTDWVVWTMMVMDIPILEMHSPIIQPNI